jgi:hypothetical protein
VFARARENARRAGCQSNLKQVGFAIMQYSQDHDEKNPIIKAYSADWPENKESWDLLIAPYAGMKVARGGAAQIFQCSSDAFPVTSSRPEHFRRSYAVNALYNWVNGGGIAEEVGAPDRQGLNIMVPLAQIAEPAGTIMVAETAHEWNLFGSPDGSEVRGPKQPSWASWWQGQQGWMAILNRCTLTATTTCSPTVTSNGCAQNALLVRAALIGVGRSRKRHPHCI